MSAFMCSKETIWDIALYFAKEYPRQWYWLLKKNVDVGDIYKALAELNVKSLIERYGEDAVPEMTGPLPELYCYKGGSKLQDMEKLCVELDCYLYQSCEGDCYRDPIYKLTQKIFDAVMHDALFSKISDDIIIKYWR